VRTKSKFGHSASWILSLSLALSLAIAPSSLSFAQNLEPQQAFADSDLRLVQLETNRVLADSKELLPVEKKLNMQQRKMLRSLLLQVLLSPLKIMNENWPWSKKSDFKDLSQESMSANEIKIFSFLATLVEKQQVAHYMNMNKLIDRVLTWPVIGKKVKAKEEFLRGYLIPGGSDGIEAVVKMRGLVADSVSGKKLRWTDWSQYSANALKRLKEQEQARTAPVENSIHDVNFLNEILQLGETEFHFAESVQILRDGPESFARRDIMIQSAKNSIEMMVWCIRDDFTGDRFVAQIAEKLKQGVRVRIMVDGKVSRFVGYSKNVKRLREMGAQVVRWVSPETSYLIQHRKALIVDGQSYIAGGLNVGDAYSHLNPDPKSGRWRDTDVYVSGAEATAQVQNLFGRLWNQQLESYPHIYRDFDKIQTTQIVPSSSGLRTALIESTPGEKRDAGTTIFQVILKSIRGAQRTVDIENAYVILSPALKQEIQDAIKRGVRVRVFTNSATSVDEAIISLAMVKNAKDLKAMGVEVFVKKDETLHSKIMIVDEVFSLIKSYNFHPRSERTDTEIAILVFDTGFGQKMQRLFNFDTGDSFATRVEKAEHLKVDQNWMERLKLNISLRLGYDVL
jgi:cardiolipin synthase A/B